ncbi:uracil-DNA glycosylase-like protein [Coniochaeta sp. 2T2.1]|nr:uracil-DNA glycosylase-like protein [Coniochaeta sp. 2T2.1]
MSPTLKRKAAVQTGPDAAKKAKAQGSITSFFGPPKVTPAAAKSSASASGTTAPEQAAAAVSKFDKAKWVASLTEEQRDLLRLEIDTLHESWLALLKDEIVSRDFLELKKFLDREYNAGKKIFPPKEDVYSWSRHTPFNTVKVVILGQDPYHNINQAHGLAFSVPPPTPTPPSLRNMYICLKNDYPSFTPPPNKGGLLTPWADRGVLMLNTCLTVRAHEANSHANRGWEKFTQKVIDLVAAKRTRGVVFMAWGTPAGKRVVKVDAKRHLVLKSVHPSPLSASRGFFDCGHFRKANEWLVQRYGEQGEVDWALVEGNSTLSVKKKEEGEGEEKVVGEVVEAGEVKKVEAKVEEKVEVVVEKKGKEVDVKEAKRDKEGEIVGDENVEPEGEEVEA